MIVAFDTYYTDAKARTVGIVFDNWTSSDINTIYTDVMENPADYIPGVFYKRELPCIIRLLSKVKERDIESLVIDGFVYLDDSGRFGLGGHLYNELKGRIPVIGVAKSDFSTVVHNKRLVFRGKSLRPLFVSAIGMDVDQAAKNINAMTGPFRIPALLKELDRLTKKP